MKFNSDLLNNLLCLISQFWCKIKKTQAAAVSTAELKKSQPDPTLVSKELRAQLQSVNGTKAEVAKGALGCH